MAQDTPVAAEPPAGGTSPVRCEPFKTFKEWAEWHSGETGFNGSQGAWLRMASAADKIIAAREAALASSRSALQQAEAVVTAARVVLEAANATRRYLAGEGDQSENAGLEIDLQRVLAVKGLRAALTSLDASPTGTRNGQ